MTKFNIIKHRGSPNEAYVEIPLGDDVIKFKAFRQEHLFAPHPYDALIPCLDYDNHFIYEIPDDPMFAKHNFPAFMCTCGSYAIIIGNDAYKTDASPEGLVWACYWRNGFVDPETHELYGKHADGST